MTDAKPRMWLHCYDEDKFLSVKDLNEPASLILPFDEIHVIEKSAYVKLKAELEVVQKERDACIKQHNQHVDIMKEWQKLLAEAADKIQALERENKDLKQYGTKPCPTCGDYFESNEKLQSERDDLKAELKATWTCYGSSEQIACKNIAKNTALRELVRELGDALDYQVGICSGEYQPDGKKINLSIGLLEKLKADQVLKEGKGKECPECQKEFFSKGMYCSDACYFASAVKEEKGT